jgi:hypothetical protein
MKIIKLLFAFLIITNVTNGQNYTREDIYTTNKVYFYGYDFSSYKLIDDNKPRSEQEFIFSIIQIMNEHRPVGYYAEMLRKDTVIFDQTTVNTLNSKFQATSSKAPLLDMSGNINNGILNEAQSSISIDSLQNIVNKYNTNGKSGIGFVQVVECFYKPKKRSSMWFIFFDISSKKILDTFENTNPDADSWKGLATYWSVGLGSGMGFFLSDHYLKDRKAYLKKNKK